MAKTKAPWLKLRKKTDPEWHEAPPVRLGNHSNGEYYHEQTPRERLMRKEIMRRADEKARYIGMDRREFLASSMGMATTMAVINQMGCGSGSSGGKDDGVEPDGGGGGPEGGSGTIPDDPWGFQ